MSVRTFPDDPDEQHPLLVQFRKELRRLRTKHGWTQATLARKLEGWTGDAVSLIEIGRRNPTPKFARACDRVFQTGESFEHLVKNAGIDEDEDGLSDLVAVERSAITLRTWEPMTMPGLLQTEAYAYAINRPWLVVDGDRDPDKDVKERLARQEIFNQVPPPSFAAIIGEWALHHRIGGPKVMRGQLAHLLEISERPRVSVQILHADVGAHVGVLGAFTFATFADNRPGMVYQETATGQGRLSANPDLFARVTRIYDALMMDVLNTQASRAKIEQVMEEEWPE